MARVFIEPSARKFREECLSISLNDRKKDTRPFDVDYIYLGKIDISAARAAIFSLCYLTNVINNTGTRMLSFSGELLIAEGIYRIRIYFRSGFVRVESDRIFRWKSSFVETLLS